MSESQSENGSNHYVDGERMTVLAVEARDTGCFSDELIQMFYVLARKTFDHLRDRLRTLKSMEEDAEQQAVIECHEATRRFDPQTGPAYNYFLTVVLNSFPRQVRNLRRQKRFPELPVLDIDELVTEPTRCNRVAYLYRKSARRNRKEADEQ